MVEKEPVTIVLSEKGWVRSLKGHREDISDLKFKEGDNWIFFLHATTVDNILLIGSNGRSYTVSGDKFTQKRGFGEPLSLLIDLPNNSQIIEMKILENDREIIIASNVGRGFIVKEDDLFALTRTGKHVLTLTKEEYAKSCFPIEEDDDYVEDRRRIMNEGNKEEHK